MKDGESMRKIVELHGSIEVTPEVDSSTFADEFLTWVESKGWAFTGGFNLTTED